jgi:murein DD-endopeptidase MepM/ murein hydrolase activator NlpD
MTNDSAPIETPEAQGAVPIGSPGGTNFNGMTIDEGVDASLTPAEAPTGDSSKAAAPPTTLSDVIKDVGTWGRLKPPSPSPRGKNGVGAASPGSGVTEAPRRKIPIQDAVPSIPVEGKGATLRRSWPVPVPSTGVRFPRRGEKDLNGVRYSDGRYSPEGRYRTKKGSGKPQPHRGSDVPGALGTPVRSAADGVVLQRGTQWAKVWARDPKTNKLLLKKNRNGKMVPYKVQGKGPEMAGWGNFITVLHPDGYISLYAHLQTVPSLKDGTSVRLGQQIGILGSTGNARGQGSHVHIEVRDRRGNTYNPVDWMEGRLPPRKD